MADELKVPGKVIADIVGHAAPTMYGRYRISTREEMRACVEAIPTIIRSQNEHKTTRVLDSGEVVVTHSSLNHKELSGRGGPIRTGDHLLPKQVRYQAALRPVGNDSAPACRCCQETEPASRAAAVLRSTR